jgi:hypothetical protein
LLERKDAMTTLTATTAADVVDASDGRLSLREAAAQAEATVGADTIRFAAALEGARLVLTGGELAVSRDLAILWHRHPQGAAWPPRSAGYGRRGTTASPTRCS